MGRAADTDDVEGVGQCGVEEVLDLLVKMVVKSKYQEQGVGSGQVGLRSEHADRQAAQADTEH